MGKSLRPIVRVDQTTGRDDTQTVGSRRLSTRLPRLGLGFRLLRGVVLNVSGIILLIGLWQAWISFFRISPIVMPPPRKVFTDLITRPQFYVSPFLYTFEHAGLGLVIGVAIGVLLAILSWYSGFLASLIRVPAVLLQATPIVAMTPVIARLVGYNERSVVAVAILISFFSTYVFVSAGLRSSSQGAEDLFSVLAANRASRLWRLALPAAAPSILLSLRVSAATAVLAALVAEWLVGVKGLGALLSISVFTYQLAPVWVSAILGTLLAVVAFALASLVERIGRERWT